MVDVVAEFFAVDGVEAAAVGAVDLVQRDDHVLDGGHDGLVGGDVQGGQLGLERVQRLVDALQERVGMDTERPPVLGGTGDHAGTVAVTSDGAPARAGPRGRQAGEP
ncbi:hypothetical protein GCM10009527_064920 [Actinomadura nitritigenes]